MEPRPLESVTILGGGTAGWMAAALLARLVGARRPGFKVRVVESAEIGTIGVGEATVPLIQACNGVLGIAEAEFLRATHGTYKLGIEFHDWVRPGHVHGHFFGDFGEPIEGIAPHHHWLRLRSLGERAPLADHSQPWVIARAGRFAPPEALSPAGAYRYAYHFDALAYARLLRGYSEARGAVRREGKVVGVRRRAGDGHVEALLMEDGSEERADFFLDCSGLGSLLLGGHLQQPFIDWSGWLPCDRAVAVPSAPAGAPTPYTVATARSAGWQWRIPLQHRVGNGYVYGSEFIGDDEATARLLATLEGKPLAEPRVIRFRAGRRARLWDGNCLAIGLAAGFLEPLESTSIQLIQTGIIQFINLLPGADCDPVLAAEYNRVVGNEYERIRDFIILHYHAVERDDSELWRRSRALRLPDTLAHKLEVFRACGRVPLLAEESYQEPSWVSILLGQEVWPRRHDPLVDGLDAGRLSEVFARRRASLAALAARLPTHQQAIDRRCATAPAA